MLLTATTASSVKRFLDHDRPVDAPLDGKDLEARAAETKDGYCIEYRESLLSHFERIGNFMEPEPKPISGWDMGWDKAIDLFGKGKCGQFGEQTIEKPSFVDIRGGIEWDAWDKYKGVPKALCQKMFIEQAQAAMLEFGFADKIPSQFRPGP